ncbi:MAG: L-2-amino-thiazoline-4-carboxylic acid hydrolase [Bacteriovoracaceae bacterium]|nr:L-2-amino-thiazoline-4-carboxylic acid hydrolase [Bacteriovoracaceae bacterium]
MKLHPKRQYEENAQMDFDLFNSCKYTVEKTDYFVFMSEKLGDKYEKLKSNLTDRLTELIGDTKGWPDDLEEFVQEYSNKELQVDDLLILGLKVVLMDLNFKKYNITSVMDKTKLKVDVNDYSRAMFFARYQRAKILESVLSKDDAIDLYKQLVDYLILKYPKDKKDNVRDYLLANYKEIPQVFKKSFISTEFEIDEGTSGYKIEKCRFADLMKSLNDPDICYAVACYYDFLATISENPNVVLTRTKTLVEGNSFCDFCYHDKRIHSDPKHPDEIFWEKL